MTLNEFYIELTKPENQDLLFKWRKIEKSKKKRRKMTDTDKENCGSCKYWNLEYSKYSENYCPIHESAYEKDNCCIYYEKIIREEAQE